ncbi:Ldh family oxidoreductase [Candidatus Parcubacteria bacterium]|nr:Ldh family oxidoreductase [Candidatus Parcubacteria bacterium]
MKIKVKELKCIVKKALLKKFNKTETDLITDTILFGELSGKISHGIGLLVGEKGVLTQEYSKKVSFINKSKFSIIIEANNNPGILVNLLAMDKVIGLAKKNSFGIVGTKGSFTSSGCLSYFLEKIAQKNLISIIMTRAIKSTAPHNGIEPIFSTNPIAIGMPANPCPVIFDMSTSAISVRAISNAKILGQRIPQNVAIDNKGNITTDPQEASKGAMLTFDRSYKGSGLAMMIEIFAGLWTGAGFVGHNENNGWGNIFMAFSPDLLMETGEFKENIKLLIKTIKNSKTKDGKKVRIAGENTIRNRNKNLKKGEIIVSREIIRQVQSFIKN